MKTNHYIDAKILKDAKWRQVFVRNRDYYPYEDFEEYHRTITYKDIKIKNAIWEDVGPWYYSVSIVKGNKTNLEQQWTNGTSLSNAKDACTKKNKQIIGLLSGREVNTPMNKYLKKAKSEIEELYKKWVRDGIMPKESHCYGCGLSCNHCPHPHYAEAKYIVVDVVAEKEK